MGWEKKRDEAKVGGKEEEEGPASPAGSTERKACLNRRRAIPPRDGSTQQEPVVTGALETETSRAVKLTLVITA